MHKSVFSVRTMTEVAVFAALGYVLDYLAGLYSAPLFPDGGSIGIALVCVYLVAFRRGVIPGIITGLIMGLLDMADGFYSIASAWYNVVFQVCLDYVIAYPLAAFAGVFSSKIAKAVSKRKMVAYVASGCVLGGFLKYLSHFVSGILFWPADNWHVGGSYIYSLLYNGAYMLPSIIVSGLIMCVIAYRQPKVLTDPDSFSLRIAAKGDK